MRRKLLTAILCGLGGLGCFAADEVPCLILTGPSDAKQVLDLSEYNRITLGDDSMTVSNADDPDKKIELLYSVYNRLQFGEGIPAGIPETDGVEDTILNCDIHTNQLLLSGNSDDVYSVGIFNIDGILVCRTVMKCGETESLESLIPGIYIAIAVNGNDILKLKFVK